MPLVLLVLSLLLCACGSAAAALEGDLRYVRSGGIGGDVRELLVRPDGQATLRSRRGGDREFKLSRQELEELAADAEAVRAAKRMSEPATPDALIHTVSYDGRTATADDPHLPRSGLAPLIARLERMLEAQRR